MKRCLHTLVCLIAAVHLVGGHWGVLQLVAWARMLEDYTGERGLIVGVKETFDGEHGCEMCLKIAAEKSKEDKQQLPLSKSGKDTLAQWSRVSPTVVLCVPPWHESETMLKPEPPLQHPAQWDAQPPVPPPERAA